MPFCAEKSVDKQLTEMKIFAMSLTSHVKLIALWENSLISDIMEDSL